MKNIVVGIGLLVGLLVAQVAVLGGAAGALEQAKQLKNDKKYAEAETLLRAEVQKNPKDAEAQRLLGWVYTAQDKRAEAKAAFNAALPLVAAGDPRQKEIKDALARLDQPAAASSGKSLGGAIDKVGKLFESVKTLQGEVTLDVKGKSPSAQGKSTMLSVAGKATVYFDEPNGRGRFDLNLSLPEEVKQQLSMQLAMLGMPPGNDLSKVSIIANKEGFHLLFPGSKTGLKMVSPPGGKATAKGKSVPPMAGMPGAPSPADLLKVKDQALGKMKRMGTQQMSGQTCDVYEINEPGTKAKLWFRANDGMPVRATFDGGAEGRGTLDFKNVKVNQPVAASHFLVPTGYKLTDLMESMNQMMGKMGKSGMTGKGGMPGKPGKPGTGSTP